MDSQSESYRVPGERAPGHESHGVVQEHLEEYLKDDWTITSIHTLESGGDISGCGWIVVKLSKP